MKMKLCLIYNYAQHYRSGIFKLIDRTFDCDFVFGDNMGDVIKMDYSLLHGKITEVHTLKLPGGLSWQPIISQLFKNYDVYIILGETRALSTWVFCILSRIVKPYKKLFFWSHAWYGKESKIEKIIKKIFFRLPNCGVFCYGNYARNLMIEEGFNANRIYTIHNSLAYDKQIIIRKSLKELPIYKNHFGNQNKNLFFFFCLTHVKNLGQLLEAVAICKNNGVNYNVTLIGTGEEKEELQSLSKRLDIGNQVWFYGPCYDERELGSLIYNADLCVAPGNIGLTAMHSMVYGTPCITHDDFKYQMPEFEAIVDGVTGTFFRRNDVDDLSSKIEEWFVVNKNKREEIRLACMKEIDENWTPYFQINVLKKYLNK